MLYLDWVGPMCLSPGEVRKIPDLISGVYMLHSFVPAIGGYPVFYVGRTIDLRRRLLEHAGLSTKSSVLLFRSSAAAYFSAAAVLQSELLPRIEAGLIRALLPPCNDQIPAAEPVLVDLPPLRATIP